MKTIITIQHTQSVHHTNGMVGSWTDWDLTTYGRKQAKRLGKNLSKEFANRKFVMYSSDLKRAKQTADIIGGYMKISPILTKELRERNLGKCCGKSVEWLKENIECQEVSIDDKMFFDAESRRDVLNRLLPFFHKVITSNEENIIIVSHGDLLSVFNSMWLGLDVESLNCAEMFGYAGGVSIMLIDDNGKHIIKKLSDMSYLKNRKG